jgi:L-fucose mutarotase
MLKIPLLHPDILLALASNGHGARVLIADANFPFATCTPATCKKVFLNLSPGVLTVTQVLKIIQEHVPIETAIIMSPPDGSQQPIHAEFSEILGDGIIFQAEKRVGFYRETKSEETCLLIATGDTRRFANILIVIGSIRPDAGAASFGVDDAADERAFQGITNSREPGIA